MKVSLGALDVERRRKSAPAMTCVLENKNLVENGPEDKEDDTTCGRCGREYEVTSKGIFYCTCWTPQSLGDQIFEGSEDIDYNGD
jgi:hypothetical protein